MIKEKIYERLEKGQQLGIEKLIEKDHKAYWYSYAVQKVNNIYYVYELEVAEDRLFLEGFEMEGFSHENINRYLSIQDFQCLSKQLNLEATKVRKKIAY